MACLESKEYMEVRNALHVLTRTIEVFPRMKKLSDHLDKRVANQASHSGQAERRAACPRSQASHCGQAERRTLTQGASGAASKALRPLETPRAANPAASKLLAGSGCLPVAVPSGRCLHGRGA